MSLGGFTAHVRSKTLRVSGGLAEPDVPYVDSDMKFEGKVAVFNYNRMSNGRGFPKNAQPLVWVEVRFTEKQESFGTREQPYIGSIRYWENEEGPQAAIHVDVTLPILMVPLLQSMRNDQIQVETIHKIIEVPTERQRENHIVALVKRIYFEIYLQQNDTKPRRGFSVSFG